jgi:hypothetical protein
MRIYPYSQLPLHPKDIVFKQSRLPTTIGIVACLFLIGLGIVIIRDGAGWFGWYFTSIIAIIMLIAFGRLFHLFSPKNWFLRFNFSRILINIAPAFAKVSESDPILELRSDEIEWIRIHRQITLMPNRTRKTTSETSYLEIKLRNGNFDELRSCLATATVPRKWRGWTIHAEAPVRLMDDDILRLVWRSRQSFVAPSLEKALALLGKQFPVQEELSDFQDNTISTADKQKMEEQVIEFVAQGRLIDATKLAQKRYGYSLTQARTFVEDLRGKTTSPKE